MSDRLVKSLSAGIESTFALCDKFVEVCPDALWGKTFGGWPVWQQLFHAYAAVDFFLRPQEAPPSPTPFADGVANFKSVPESAPDKKTVQEFMAGAKARVFAYVMTLNDGALAELNEGPSARMGRECTHAAILALIASHTMYHLGACDAALREQGVPGVF